MSLLINGLFPQSLRYAQKINSPKFGGEYLILVLTG